MCLKGVGFQVHDEMCDWGCGKVEDRGCGEDQAKRSEVRSSAEWIQVSKLKKWSAGQGGRTPHTHLGAGQLVRTRSEFLRATQKGWER